LTASVKSVKPVNFTADKDFTEGDFTELPSEVKRLPEPAKPVNFTTTSTTLQTLQKPAAKLQRIIDWLNDPANADKVDLSSREIAKLIGGVSHTLVAKAKDK
jgi:hypothetical protein